MNEFVYCVYINKYYEAVQLYQCCSVLANALELQIVVFFKLSNYIFIIPVKEILKEMRP